jgi:hypothetical protein
MARVSPKRLNDRIEFGEVRRLIVRVAAIEPQARTVRKKQSPAKSALEERQPHQSLFKRAFRRGKPLPCPGSFDLTDSFGHEATVYPVGTAMKRQAHLRRCGGIGRQQKPVTAEVVESDPVPADHVEQRRKTGLRDQLAREQVMALHPGLITGFAAPVDPSEGKPVTRCHGGCLSGVASKLRLSMP